MSYLRDEPDFDFRVLLRGPRQSELLVTGQETRWKLPRFVSREQHTSEVAFVNRTVRRSLGLEATVLRCLWTNFDEPQTVVRKLYVLEAHGVGWTPKAVGGAWLPAETLVRHGAEDRDVAAVVEAWAREPADRLVIPDGQEWFAPGWWDRMLAWARERLHPVHVRAAEQLRSSEFSCVVRLETEAGAAFLKAVAASLAREVAVTAQLSRVPAGGVPPVLAVDLPQRWMLLRGAPGRPLDESRDLAVWERAATAYGRFQLAAASSVDALAVVGCPTLTAAQLQEDVLEVLASDEAMQAGRPGGLEPEQVWRLRTLKPQLLAATASLQSSAVSVSVDHGDLWPENVFCAQDGCQVVDWEDARIAHPFLSLFPLLAGARMLKTFANPAAARARIRDAYLEVFAGFAPAAALRELFGAAHDLAAVRMAATYLRAPPAIQRAHPWMREMPAFCLRALLERRDAVDG
jgi:hypothetical protein